jgi:hypothetical protein
MQSLGTWYENLNWDPGFLGPPALYASKGTKKTSQQQLIMPPEQRMTRIRQFSINSYVGGEIDQLDLTDLDQSKQDQLQEEHVAFTNDPKNRNAPRQEEYNEATTTDFLKTGFLRPAKTIADIVFLPQKHRLDVIHEITIPGGLQIDLSIWITGGKEAQLLLPIEVKTRTVIAAHTNAMLDCVDEEFPWPTVENRNTSAQRVWAQVCVSSSSSEPLLTEKTDLHIYEAEKLPLRCCFMSRADVVLYSIWHSS